MAMASNPFECKLLVTNASVLRRKSYVIVAVEGVFTHDNFVLHTGASRLFDDDSDPLVAKVEALSPGDYVKVAVSLVPRRKDNRSYLAFELIDILN